MRFRFWVFYICLANSEDHTSCEEAMQNNHPHFCNKETGNSDYAQAHLTHKSAKTQTQETF